METSKFEGPSFHAALLFAVVVDVGSLIPGLGIFLGGVFDIYFLLYKGQHGLLRKTWWITPISYLCKIILWFLPSCLFDVWVTHITYKVAEAAGATKPEPEEA